MKKQTEDIFEPAIPVVLPGWDVLPFEQAVDVISDKSKRVKQGAYLPSGKLPVIDQGQDFIGGYTDDEDMVFEGELPVILFGDHTRSIKYVDRPFAVGAEGVKILKPSGGFDPKYLYYLLRSLQIPSRGYSRHFQFLRKFHFPRAPEGQQKHIVAEIEKQFSRLDEAVANLKRVKANLKRYKAAVLKAAVEGRLVETEAELARKKTPSPLAGEGSTQPPLPLGEGGGEGTSYETGAQLLQRILETRRSQWKGKGKYKEPAAPDTTDLPKLPEGWVCVSVDMVCEIVDGDRGSEYPNKTDFKDIGHCLFLSTANVRPDGFLFDEVQFIDKDKHERMRKGTLERGDIVFTSRGTIGNIAYYGKGVPFECVRINSGMFILRGFSDLLDEKFLEWYLRSPAIRRQIDRLKSGTAQPQLPIREFRTFKIAFPGRAEQTEIVKEIERRFSVIESLEGAVQVGEQRAERLRQSVLGAAFSGRLFSSTNTNLKVAV